MSEEKGSKLNHLQMALPQGLIVDSGWMEKNGFQPSLRNRYVSSGWLEQPARGVYRRPKGQMTDAPLRWQQVVLSLQLLLEYPLIVGGMTALDLHGFTHYRPRPQDVHLYGRVKPPGWPETSSTSRNTSCATTPNRFLPGPIGLPLGSLAYPMSAEDTARDHSKLTAAVSQKFHGGSGNGP